MPDNDQLDSVRLDDAAARRLLERATELDAKLGNQSTVAELREAARGAGISEEAFRRALAEVRQESAPVPVAVAPAGSSRRRTVLIAVLAFVIAGMGIAFLRNAVIIPNIAEHEAVPAARAPSASPPADQAPAVPAPSQQPAPARAPRSR